MISRTLPYLSYFVNNFEISEANFFCDPCFFLFGRGHTKKINIRSFDRGFSLPLFLRVSRTLPYLSYFVNNFEISEANFFCDPCFFYSNMATQKKNKHSKLRSRFFRCLFFYVHKKQIKTRTSHRIKKSQKFN